ncbi:hypothetical protein N7G274_001010 [Stereocaulon virgatum]|uniref:S-adenosyl-L-methionine-dependent methyltransferase n=1 Tax=Stereocaulon virgatum TaxID=373712 RepID=A0ABR4AML7_9LECA
MASPPRNTVAVDPKYRELITIHDRDFQKYSIENTVHLVPVDEREIERLEAQHRVFSLMFDGKLIFPPMTKVENVLDCGYGSASWAIEVAEQYPDCEVIGVDISPHMKPDDTPENFWPEVCGRPSSNHVNHGQAPSISLEQGTLPQFNSRPRCGYFHDSQNQARSKRERE